MANKKIGGVAAGLADYFGVDVTLIRILFVLGAFFGNGIGVVLYILGWIAMPTDSASVRQLRVSKRSTTIVFTVIAVIVGAGLVMNANWRVIPGLVFVAVLVFVVLKFGKKGSWKKARQLQQDRRDQERWQEPSAQEAPPMYFGGDPQFQIDSFYPQSSPTNPMFPPTTPYPPTTPPYPPTNPPYPASPTDPQDPWSNPSGFQQQ